MKARDFCYWLMGALEVGDLKTMNEAQVAEVKNHLNMVFIHDIDPSFPPEEKAALDKAHTGGPTKLPGVPLADRPDEPRPRC